MIYQVKANLYFKELDEARDFYHDCEVAMPKSIVINQDAPDQEGSSIELIENHHDEEPHVPCSVIEEMHYEPE